MRPRPAKPAAFSGEEFVLGPPPESDGMSKVTLLDLTDYKREVDRLYDLVQERRQAAGSSPRDGRVPFRDIELGEELEALMNVEFSTHQEYGGQSVKGVNDDLKHKARLVCLAALCELIKNEYQGDFWGLYQEWTGKIADSRMYKSILERGFADEGLVKAEEDKRYTDALIAEAGLPRKMLPDVADLFILYWKYFHPMDVRDLFRYVKGSAEEQKRVKILPEEAEKLRRIVDACKEFPTAVNHSIADLSTLMETLSEREELQPLDLVDRPERFEAVCGINPLRIFRGAVALRNLAQRIVGAITPEKFRRIVLSLAPGTRVILPSGQMVDTDYAGDVPYFGRYRIGAASYLVMPNELLPAEDVNVYPEHHLSTLGNRVIYKAREDFVPLEGDAESPIIPRELFIEGRSRGFLWFRSRPVDRAVRVGKQKLYPDEGLHWQPEIRHQDGSLTVEVQGIRLYDPKLVQKEIALAAFKVGEPAPAAARGEDQLPEVWFPTDRDGLGGISHAILPLSGAAPGEYVVTLRNRRTAEALQIAGTEPEFTLTLAPAMLFGSRHAARVLPSDRTQAFGESTMTLFVSEDLPAELQETPAYTLSQIGTFGAYRAWNLAWKTEGAPFVLDLGGPLVWKFGRISDIHFDFMGTPSEDAFFRLPSGPDRILRSWDDLWIVLAPDLDAGQEREVDLALFANDTFVAERSLEATERLAGMKPGRPIEFVGAHIRRGFGLGETASGHYRLELRRERCTLAAFTFTVLPSLDVTDLPMHPFVEGEEVSYLVTSRVRCFPDDTNRRRAVFGGVQVPATALGVGQFVAPTITTALPLERPYISLTATFEPPVCGWRLYDDSAPSDDPGQQFLKKSTVARDDLAKYGLVLFGTDARAGTILVNESPVRQLEFYEGYAFLELSDLIDRVTGRVNKITPVVGDRKLSTLTVTWTPRIYRFERVAEYMAGNALRFSIDFEGPQGDVIRLLVKDPDGRTLAREDITCEGRLERRDAMEVKIREDLSAYPFVTLHATIPAIAADHEFGLLDFFNQARDADMKAILERIEKEPSNPEAYWIRAELYRTKGLLDLSVQDYSKALTLGLRDSSKRKRAEDSIALQDWFNTQLEIHTLANFFIPFCRKELHLEY